MRVPQAGQNATPSSSERPQFRQVVEIIAAPVLRGSRVHSLTLNSREKRVRTQ